MILSQRLHPFVGCFCSFFEEFIVFSKLKSSRHNQECSTSANLSRIKYRESSLDPQFSRVSRIKCQLTFERYYNYYSDYPLFFYLYSNCQRVLDFGITHFRPSGTTQEYHFWCSEQNVLILTFSVPRNNICSQKCARPGRSSGSVMWPRWNWENTS